MDDAGCSLTISLRVDGKERALRATWTKASTDAEIGAGLRQILRSAGQTVAMVHCSGYQAMDEESLREYAGSRSLEAIHREEKLRNG